MLASEEKHQLHQIIAQIIIFSENFLNKGSRLKNCILLSERYYHHSGVGELCVRECVIIFHQAEKCSHYVNCCRSMNQVVNQGHCQYYSFQQIVALP